MATQASGTYMTLAEILRREAPNGLPAELIDVISQINEFVNDAVAEECNKVTSHETTRVASKPSGTERVYGQGVGQEAAVTEKIDEPTELLSGMSIVDRREAEKSALGLYGFISQEDGLYVSGMIDNTFIPRFFDGNRSTNPLQINGINNRSDYNALSSNYVYDNAGGNASVTSNKSSIYIVQFGPKMVTMIYPRNGNLSPSSPVERVDYGFDLQADPYDSTKMYPAHRTWFEAEFGLFIHDPRCIKRIVNISTTNIDGVDDFSFDEDVLIDAYNDLEYGGRGAVIYANRTMKSQIMKRANEKGNAMYDAVVTAREGEGPFARPITRFWGIPIREVAAITNTQATVT